MVEVLVRMAGRLSQDRLCACALDTSQLVLPKCRCENAKDDCDAKVMIFTAVKHMAVTFVCVHLIVNCFCIAWVARYSAEVLKLCCVHRSCRAMVLHGVTSAGV